VKTDLGRTRIFLIEAEDEDTEDITEDIDKNVSFQLKFNFFSDGLFLPFHRKTFWGAEAQYVQGPFGPI